MPLFGVQQKVNDKYIKEHDPCAKLAMPNDKADALGEFYKVHGYTKLDLFALGCVDCCL